VRDGLWIGLFNFPFHNKFSRSSDCTAELEKRNRKSHMKKINVIVKSK
jgi:hypothetical protein